MAQIEDLERFLDDLNRAFRADDPTAGGRAREAGHVDRVRRLYGRLGRGEFAEAVAELAESARLEIIGPPGHPFTGRWDGHAAILAAIRTNFAVVAEQRIDVRSVVAQGHSVVVVAHERGRHVPTGEPYEVDWVQVFTFNSSGRIAWVGEFFGGPAADWRVDPGAP